MTERLIIYILVVINVTVGFIFIYRKPRPFGRKTYDKLRNEKNSDIHS